MQNGLADFEPRFGKQGCRVSPHRIEWLALECVSFASIGVKLAHQSTRITIPATTSTAFTAADCPKKVLDGDISETKRASRDPKGFQQGVGARPVLRLLVSDICYGLCLWRMCFSFGEVFLCF